MKLQAWWYATLLALTVWGAALRFYHLDAQSYWMDEAFSVQAAHAIGTHGYVRCENGEIGRNWLPAHYAMALSMSVGPPDESAARFPSALSGTLTIPATAFLSAIITQSAAASIATAALMAFSVPDIAWSRQARGYALLVFLGIAGLLCLAASRGATRSRRTPQVAGLISLLLAMLTHRAGFVYGLIPAIFLLREWHPGQRPRWSLVTLCILPVAIMLLAPSGASQSLKAIWTDVLSNPIAPSYTRNYANVILDFFGWNTIWLLVGIVGLLAQKPSYGWSLGLGVGAYFLVIAECNMLFHVRYLLPIIPFLHLFIAYGPVSLVLFGERYIRPEYGRLLAVALVSLTFIATSLTQNLGLEPTAEYELGPTEPQAPWREGFAWLLKRDPNPVTIMPLPAFHDIYAGPSTGKKYFLPFSFSGLPDSWETNSPYSRTTTVNDEKSFRSLSGYLIFDRFSYRSLRDDYVKQWLEQHRPVYVSDPAQNLLIWKKESGHP